DGRAATGDRARAVHQLHQLPGGLPDAGDARGDQSHRAALRGLGALALAALARMSGRPRSMQVAPLPGRAVNLALAASLLFSAVFIGRTAATIGGETYFTLFDDAMISMRYARNLA